MKFYKLLFLFLFTHAVGFSQDSAELTFSHNRGFYFNKFQLKISCDIPDVIIKYTLGGYDLESDQSKTYTNSIIIQTTTVLKAGAFLADSLVSDVEVHSFIFPEDVVTQPSEIINYPKKQYPIDGRGRNFAEFDNEMDPSIVNHPAYKDSIIPALLSIPSVIISMPPEMFWEFYDGEETVKTSVEIIYPDKSLKNEQIFCGIKPHSHLSMKRSMRVLFKDEFGPKKFESNLLKKSPLNSENATTTFDHLVFRAGNNQSWARRPSGTGSTYTRDQWYRDTQILMSGDGVRGMFAHLYINGLYWGLYNIAERPDENFLEDYYGGNKDNWTSLSHSKNSSSKRRFNYLVEKLLSKNELDDKTYNEIQDYVDIKNFCDYILLTWFTAMKDWPYNNWWAGINNNPEGKLKFFGWDCELSFNNLSSSGTILTEFRQENNYKNNLILNLWNALKTNEEFLMFFADRVFHHCYNNGWLSPEKAKQTWGILNNNIRLAIIAESARWGDAVSSNPKGRESDWVPEVIRIGNVLDKRNEQFIEILKKYGFFPKVSPPEVIEFKNNIQEPSIKVTNPNNSGSLVYCIDGTDPRLAGGMVNKNSIFAETDPLILKINKGFLLKARIKQDKNWSALLEIPIIPENNYDNFKLTEIMFNPDSMGQTGGKNFEFLEFKNTGTELLDISGIYVKDAISYTFPEPTILSPGQFFILAEDAAWFTFRYGFEPDGVYQGNLNNEGATISILTPQNKKIIQFDYSSLIHNSGQAENNGYSLTLKEGKEIDPSNNQNWQFSKIKGGTPGKGEPENLF